MIAQLRGRAVSGDGEHVVVDVGGVGYRVFIPASTHRRVRAGQEVTLLIHTHVREDAIHLFGFATAEERELFETLLGVSGIGPRLALTILSAFSPERFERAILDADLAALTRVPGIGRKTAERIVLELKDRVARRAAPAAGSPVPESDGTAFQDALAALLALGYSPQEAQPALARARSDRPDGDAQALVRLALRHLTR